MNDISDKFHSIVRLASEILTVRSAGIVVFTRCQHPPLAISGINCEECSNVQSETYRLVGPGLAVDRVRDRRGGRDAWHTFWLQHHRGCWQGHQGRGPG